MYGTCFLFCNFVHFYPFCMRKMHFKHNCYSIIIFLCHEDYFMSKMFVMLLKYFENLIYVYVFYYYFVKQSNKPVYRDHTVGIYTCD